MAIEKEIKNLLFLNRPVQNGFEYRDWPVIVPVGNGTDVDIQLMHWEYIPESIHDADELSAARKKFTWLNAKGENILINEKGRESMYREGALEGRVLALSTGFFEWRHIPKIGKRGQPLKETEKIPYYITVDNNEEYFFMAGVSRVWHNLEIDQKAATFAVVTTNAVGPMIQIHNTKKRMPVILPPELAFEWIQNDLTEERIAKLATHQYDPVKIKAWPVAKNFLYADDPTKEFHYDNLPSL
ncbi:SOS response-associated peptidase family protein [Lacibacter sp. H375]|uniref:SOS response-associated peptidase n=1 Tax=Lacibacter sp. H375 TaxID=3133424 RepID=UPI0030C1627B